MVNKFKSIAEEINNMKTYGKSEEDINMVFNSDFMNTNYDNMLDLAHAIFSEELLYLPDEAVFEEYNDFVKDFDFDTHTEMLGNDFDCWFEYGESFSELMPVLELYSKILYAIKYKIENEFWVFGNAEFSVIYNIYMRMLPHVPAKYLV